MSKIIVITGAGEGLGKSIATRLAKENTVIILDNKPEPLEQTSKELNCKSFVCDITKPKEVKETVAEIISDHGKIDVLVNNAGIWIQGLLEDSDDERIAETFNVNCVGTIYMTKYVIPHMKKSDSGTIMNIISTAGIAAKAERSVYNSSKWAMTGFTKCIQDEVKGTTIRVMGFYPSLMRTNLFKNAGIDRNDYDKALDPDELAKTIEFVLSLDPTTSLPEVGIRNILY